MRPPSVARLQFLDLTQEGNIGLMKASIFPAIEC